MLVWCISAKTNPGSFGALLDKLLLVMEPSLVGSFNPPILSGLTFFTTKFRWVANGNQEMDCNVCMPWNGLLVRRAIDMYVTSNGYLLIRLGDRLDEGNGATTRPCMEYAHRLVCFLFKKGPTEIQPEVSHRCHNKECLNPSHLLWSTHEDNENQPKRQHSEE